MSSLCLFYFYGLVNIFQVVDNGIWKYMLVLLLFFRRKFFSLREASKESCRLGELKDHEKQLLDEKECGQDPFEDFRQRFLSFKRKNFL